MTKNRSRPPPACDDVAMAFALADMLRGCVGKVSVVGRVSDQHTKRQMVDVEVIRRWLDTVAGERVPR